MNNLEKKIIDIVNKSNYEKGKSINPDNILNQKTLTIMGSDKIFKYKVKSSNNDNVYNIQLIMKNGEIISTSCTCKMYEATHSCKHIATVLINKATDFFKEEVRPLVQKNNNDVSKQIIDLLYNQNKHINKSELKLELEIKFVHYYYKDGAYISFKIGENKLYSTNSKLSSFFNIYLSEDGTMLFGKEFTFNPKYQYFNDEDNKIINFLKDEYFSSKYDNYEGLIFLDMKIFLNFIKLIKNKQFSVFPYYTFNGYLEENPFSGEIIKKNNYYLFSIEDIEKYKFLDYHHTFLVKNDLLYKIPDQVNMLIELFKKYKVNSITFEQKDLPKFTKGFETILNENINIEDDIKDKFIVTIPKVELYFDFDEEITCKIKYIYADNEVYYGDINNEILRNETYEEEVTYDMLNNKFIQKSNIFILNSIDEYDYFINILLPLLSKKYTIFTTEKLDKIQIIKKTKICSHFTIGKDNIFKYDFDLDDINPDEFDNIFNSISSHKKYYKLKNGSLLNLQDENLNEFRDLVKDMTLDISNINSRKEYIIPKYKALYLDSLKRKKYSIIKTNNLFDTFIDNFNKYKTIKMDIEDNVLREYQVIGVRWLYNIYKCGFGGILADEMGLGKSIQIIYLIKQILSEKKDTKILILAPTSLIYNWENEFNKFGSNLNYKVFAGTRPNRKILFENIENTNIIITTYGLIKEDKEEYLNMNFELMVIDEAQNIKNPKTEITKVCKSLKSSTKIALTGTPIENSVIELWSIFDFLMPGYLGALNAFEEKYNIKEVADEDLKILDTLNLQISPFILRRKKQDVLKDLPPKIENNIYLDLSKSQKKLYIEQVKQTEKEMNEIIKTEGFLKARFKILSLITKLRQICIDPKIVFSTYEGESIKMEEVINTVKKLIDDKHKILIFTSYKSALEILKIKLEKEGIKCYTIDGSVSSKKRNELVNNFNTDDTNVFLIMLKAGGTGLNLIGADTVIHLDLWWNPQAENQATDRAHRIGQNKKVQVIKFICKGTIEEKILELQQKKKILSDTLIEGETRDENIISSLNEDDFRNLLLYSNE